MHPIVRQITSMLKFGLPALVLSALVLQGEQEIPKPPVKVPEKLPISTWKQVKPILEKNCVRCHNDERSRAGVNLSSYEAVIASKIIRDKDPEKSLLARVLRGRDAEQMPRRTYLKEKQIQIIEGWIKLGAKEKDPDNEKEAAKLDEVEEPTSGG